MKQKQHTPGPWKVSDRDVNGAIIEAPHLGHLCGVAHATQRDPHPHYNGGIDQATAEANARLIAAAPDLLNALESLFEHCAMIHKSWGDGDNNKLADNAILAAREAMRKAKGE